ncbi:MAG: outer membrane protein assembly factor BamD [Acidobacteria bacterium]|nr:outer membrane protein assembly factor BamD [Acidobacteriota bacterium]
MGSRVLIWLALTNLVLPGIAQPQQQDALAEKMFLSGRNLMRDKYYQQAIQDFKSLISSYPASNFTDNALLELGRYYYHVERNSQEALRFFQQIIDGYQGRDTTADAYYYKGLLLSEGAGSDQQLQDGLANFLRTVQFYPNSLVVEDSLYHAGLVEQRLQHYEQAAEYFERCATEYPSGVAAPSAQLALGDALFYMGKTDRSMQEIQRVRDLYAERPDASAALRSLALLWRFYYQLKIDPGSLYKSQELVVPKGPALIQECGGMVFDPNQVLLFSDPKNARIHIIGSDLRVTGGLGARRPAGVFADSDGGVVAADETGLTTRERFYPLTWTKPEKHESQPVGDAEDVIRTSFGDYYVLESGRVLHFSRTLVFDSVYAPGSGGGVESISVDAQDRIALLFKDKKVNIYDRRGKLVVSIPAAGPGYAFQDPTQIRFDSYAHLYVLDRALHAIHIFDRQGKLIYQSVVTGMRSPKRLAVNGSGDIYVWDDKAPGIWVLK